MPRTPDPRPAPAHSDAGAQARLQENQRRLRRSMAAAIGIGLGLDVIVILVALLSADRPELLGAAVGTALAAVILIPNMVIARMGAALSPHSLAASLLGSWLLKMIVVIAALALIDDGMGVSRRWVGIALLVGAFLGLLAEALLLARLRPRLEVAAPPEDD